MWISRRRNKSFNREAGRRKRSHLRPKSTRKEGRKILTREQEEKEEIIYMRETKEEN